MKSTIKELVDEEDEENEEDEEEGEESEDEDYCPNPASEDEDSDGDEGVYDDVLEVGSGAAKKPAAGMKRGAGTAGGENIKIKGVRLAKRQKGGIRLKDEDDEAEPSFDCVAMAEEKKPPPAVEEKKAAGIDDLWASMNEETSVKKPPGKSSVDDMWVELNAGSSSSDKKSGSGGLGVAASATTSGGGGLDIKALLAKTGAKASVDVGGVKMVEILQRMDFCGEEMIVTKKVREGSQEDLAYRQQGNKRADDTKRMGDLGESTLGAGLGKGGSKSELVSGALAAASQLRKSMLNNPAAGGLRTDSSLEFKGGLDALPVGSKGAAAAKPTGLQGLLASLDGKKKMSTMEKSKHDWGSAKGKMDEQSRDEMERFAKDGYLAKQAFLARTDERQAEVARTNRRKGMGLKD